MANDETVSVHERWGRFRFAVIGPLLSAPPARGERKPEIERLATKTWTHPITGAPVTFGYSTIERWFDRARSANDPLAALSNRLRKDRGHRPSLPEAARRALHAQYRDHPSWTKRLHYDNLLALAEEEPSLLPMASYSSFCRYMVEAGLHRRRRVPGRDTEGFRRAVERLEKREVRSFEASHVNALWHLDFHHGKRKVVTSKGEWVTPMAFCVLDDRSRLACHVQWYLTETAEDLIHGLSQAFQKRGLPRALLTDNGAAMLAKETEQGLLDLGVVHETTLPYSPYQNGKQETWWALLEGRLVAMLDGVEDLTLRALNEATQAWTELEYNKRFHSEIRMTPSARFLAGPDVSRESPTGEELRRAFTRRETRRQRRSDGTITILSKRFEVPSRFGHFERLTVRFAQWDLSRVYLVDSATGTVLARLSPLDREKNAQRGRRSIEPLDPPPPSPATGPGLPPLMRKLLARYAATGFPFCYLKKDDEDDQDLAAAEVGK